MTTEDRSELHAASHDNGRRMPLQDTNVPACVQGDDSTVMISCENMMPLQGIDVPMCFQGNEISAISAEVENLQTQIVLKDISSEDDKKLDCLDDDIPIKRKVLEEFDLPVSSMEPDYNVEEVVEESGSGGDLTNLFIRVLKILGARFYKKLCNPRQGYIWFRDVERAMNILRVNEDEKVATAILLLGKPDLAWWLSVEKKYPVDKVITWSDFKKEFDHNFYTQAFIEEQRQEFFDLTQGLLSVREYEKRFAERSEFALSTEAEKCKRFEQGLRQDIRDSIVAIKWSDYNHLVDIAIRVEEVLRRPDPEEARKEAKKRKQDEERSSKDQVSNKRPKREEATYSDRHGGPSLDNVRACYQCGQKGHMVAKCPSKGQKTQTAKQAPSRFRRKCDNCNKNHQGKCQKEEQRSTKIVAGDDVAAEKPADICEKGPVSCFGCGQVGHYKTMCPFLVQPLKGEQRSPKMATFKSTKRRVRCRGAPATAKIPICFRCGVSGHCRDKCPTQDRLAQSQTMHSAAPSRTA